MNETNYIKWKERKGKEPFYGLYEYILFTQSLYIIHNSLILPKFSFHLLHFLSKIAYRLYTYYICTVYMVQFCGHSHKDQSLLVRW